MLKADLAGGGNLTLVLDPRVADYPWEMLAMRLDAGTARPLCVERGLLRQLDLGTQRLRAIKRATSTNALVIGNPPASPTFQALEGAKEEAVAVADLLAGQDYNVTRLIFDEQGRPLPAPDDTLDPLQGVPPDRYWEVILDELYRREYRIVHLAAHGMYDAARPSRSGAVIGPSRFLSALAFRSLRAMPELVFFNCCHLGRVDEPTGQDAPVYGQVASSVAEELMLCGIRAVVAAGWAVNDRDAVAFAKLLYEKLLDGVPFGDATRDARTQDLPRRERRLDRAEAPLEHLGCLPVLRRAGLPAQRRCARALRRRLGQPRAAGGRRAPAHRDRGRSGRRARPR